LEGKIFMNKTFNLCNSLFYVAFFMLLLISFPLVASAQTAGSALEKKYPTSTTSGNSDYRPDPVIVESYVPPSQDYCNIFKNTDTGCHVECRTRSESKCIEELIVLNVLLNREDSQSFTVKRRDSESDQEFFERYNLESVDRMLKAGVDPNSSEAKAALLSAVANGNDEIVRRLINAGTKIDPVEGGKVLLALSWSSDENIIKRILELIRLGANVDAHSGNTFGGYPEANILSRVIEAAPNNSEDSNKLKIVKALIDAKVNINQSFNSSDRIIIPLDEVLMLNEYKFRLELVKMLLLAGADAKNIFHDRVDTDTDHENTLIATGCYSADAPEIIKLLIAAGANPNYQFYSHGREKYSNVLKYYKEQTCPYKEQVISILKQAGAK
jgi:ankyrin repeat protein